MRQGQHFLEAGTRSCFLHDAAQAMGFVRCSGPVDLTGESWCAQLWACDSRLLTPGAPAAPVL